MKNKFNILLKISILLNIILIFFGSFLGNLYIIQAIAFGFSLLACTVSKLKIKADTQIWLVVILISCLSIMISIDKQSTIEIVALITMAIAVKIIYENNSNNNWQDYFVQGVFIASAVHVVATITQLIFPNFIGNINEIILGAEGLKMNQDLYRAGAYAGITAQTSVNAFYIAIFVGIIFLKVLFQKQGKKRNMCFLVIGVVALFITGKRGMLIYTLISMITVFLYVTLRDRKNGLKYFSALLVVGIIGYIAIINIPATQQIIEKNIILQERGDVLNGRDVLWKKSIEVFENNSIFGIGLGTIQNIIGEYSHNVYIQLLAETGIVGLLVYVAAFLYSMLCSLKKMDYILEQGKVNQKIIASLSVIIQFIFIAYAFSGNPLYGQIFLLPYMIAIAMINSIQINEGEEENENRNYYLS